MTIDMRADAVAIGELAGAMIIVVPDMGFDVLNAVTTALEFVMPVPLEESMPFCSTEFSC